MPPSSLPSTARRTLRLATQLPNLVEAMITASFRPLTARQFHLLEALEPPRRIHELARQFGVTPPVITMLVDRLVQRGYVRRVRVRPPHDRRTVLVEITAAGTQARDELADGLIADLAIGLAELTEAELATVQDSLALLERLMTAAEPRG